MEPQTLTVENLEKSYGERHVLRQMSLAVKPGEIYGFVGANGSGKTTTMRIILGVLDSDGGEVRYGSGPMDEAARRASGYMPEERGLYPKEKVGDQLVYLARLHGLSRTDAQKETNAILERVGLADRGKDKLEELSLGNQQRVQLAAALVHRPSLLVLDEPFSGLDPVAVRVMSECLKERARAGVPIIFSSHQLDLVSQLCHRVGIVRDGTIYAEGTVPELQARGPRLIAVAGPALAQPGAQEALVALPGVKRAVERGDDHLTLHCEEAADDQPLLRTALQYGAVTTFGPAPLALADIFQEVVSDESPEYV